MLNSGVGKDAVSIALAKDAVAYEHEFILAQTLIPFDYEINDQGRWTDSGGKTIEELTDPDDVGADRLGRVLRAESAMMNDPSIAMAAVASPDLGFGRNYVYLYSRGEGNAIQALAVEFHGNEDALKKFFHGLGAAGEADTSQSDDFEKPLLFSRAITPQEILAQAQETVAHEKQAEGYLTRLSRDVSVFPLILRERERQVEQMAEIALEHMIAQDDVREGLAAAVYGVIALSADTAQDTAMRVVDDTKEAFVGVIDYVKRRPPIEQSMTLVPQYESPTYTTHIEEIVRGENPALIPALTAEPAGEDFARLTEEEQVQVWNETVQDVLSVPEQTAQQMAAEVVQIWEITSRAREVLEVATEVFDQIPDVCVPAGLFMLDVLAMQPHEGGLGEGVFLIPPEMAPVVSAETASQKGIPEQITVWHKDIPNDSLEVALSFIASEANGKEKTFAPERLLRIADSVDVYTLTETVAFVKTIDTLSLAEQKNAIAHEKASTGEKILFLTGEIQRIIVGTNPETFSATKTKEEAEKKEVSQFSLAVGLWLMLKLMNYYSALSSLEGFVAGLTLGKNRFGHSQNHGLLRHISEDGKAEVLVQRESGQWLLLSIIWHLAMIREQGMQTTKTNTGKKKTVKKTIVANMPIMPLYGVIFAYGS